VEIDYDRYAHGEAMLAWLNARAHVSCDAEMLLQSLRRSLDARSVDLAHMKFTLAGKRVQLTNLQGDASVDDEPSGDELILNVRARTTPDILRDAITDALHSASVFVDLREMNALAPFYPHPQFGRT
jgi:hypothetical protein